MKQQDDLRRVVASVSQASQLGQYAVRIGELWQYHRAGVCMYVVADLFLHCYTDIIAIPYKSADKL